MRRRRFSHLPRHVVLLVAAALAFGPVLFMLMTALKTENQYLNDTLGPPVAALVLELPRGAARR